MKIREDCTYIKSNLLMTPLCYFFTNDQEADEIKSVKTVTVTL